MRRLPPIHIEIGSVPSRARPTFTIGLRGAAARWVATEQVQSVLAGEEAVKGLGELRKTCVLGCAQSDGQVPHGQRGGGCQQPGAAVKSVASGEEYVSAIAAARRKRPTEYPVTWVDERGESEWARELLVTGGTSDGMGRHLSG